MLEFIYNHSPIPFQNIMVSVKGKLFEKQRYTEHYYNELEILKECKKPFELQENRLQELYKYIKNNSLFFNQRLETYDEIITLSELTQYPILTKEDIRQNIDKIITKDKTNLIKASTGGSTGKSLRFYSDSYDMSRKIAYLDFFKEQHGVKKGMRRVSIGGKKIIPNKQKKKIFWRFNEPLNQLLFSAYHVNEENLKFYVNKLNDFKPESLDGYPSVLHRIAKYILKNNITLKFKPIAIFPTAEALTVEMKEDIENAFNAPVRNQYASSEGAPFIVENTKGELEIAPMSGVFELQHIENNIYELIVTGFYTTTTPLFRYKIGDSVELYDELPENYTQKDIKIKRIIGRNNDFLMSNERGVVTNVQLSSSIKMAGNEIIESQFVQNKLDEVIIKLVVNEFANKNKIKSILTNELKARFGNSTRFEFQFVDKVEYTGNGKKRFAINNLK